ncbi:hypothetical protein ECC02_002195 [Trypanosoma cruzi]|uniref:Uncharacterized protein n=1 Tax=Trypanosoma cruzi TaxID=5693 RepID=A0A7J6YCZ1_TRYCR|nr:hypothetical protein ECC02_002195 [Trypanosoma cruzi]
MSYVPGLYTRTSLQQWQPSPHQHGQKRVRQMLPSLQINHPHLLTPPASYSAQKRRSPAPVAQPQTYSPQRVHLHSRTTSSRQGGAAPLNKNTRRDMLGLFGSLSLPSLLLPPDPVTRRRLCVRGAFNAATIESIQICVWAVCVLLVLSESSNFTVAISAQFPSVSLCSTSGKDNDSGREAVQQQYKPPPLTANHKMTIPAVNILQHPSAAYKN